MKKIMVSLATASLIASSAMAADKGIDFTTTGQAVFYYQSIEVDGSDNDLFTKKATKASLGVELNFNADLKNNFTFGSQVTYITDLGMNKALANNPIQTIGGTDDSDNIADDVAVTKMWVAKKIANTTVKLGRQEISASVSPFAFTEGWNMFKNKIDAALVINKDLPKTTVVAGYLDGSNRVFFNNDMASFSDLTLGKGNANDVDTAAYLLTVKTKAIPMTTLTGSYYNLSGAADIMWASAVIADKSFPMGLTLSVNGGTIDVDDSAFEDTDAWSAKITAKPMKSLLLYAAYSSVDDGSFGVNNMATGQKTPLYTGPVVMNQHPISLDADTVLLKVVYNTGAYGKIAVNYSMTSDESAASDDHDELDVIHMIKAGNVNFTTMYVNRDWDNSDDWDVFRFVARYNF